MMGYVPGKRRTEVKYSQKVKECGNNKTNDNVILISRMKKSIGKRKMNAKMKMNEEWLFEWEFSGWVILFWLPLHWILTIDTLLMMMSMVKKEENWCDEQIYFISFRCHLNYIFITFGEYFIPNEFVECFWEIRQNVCYYVVFYFSCLMIEQNT